MALSRNAAVYLVSMDRFGRAGKGYGLLHPNPEAGSFRKLGVPSLGFLIIRILLKKGTIFGSPIFGNSLIVNAEGIWI